jgi:hypothetical protein
MKQNYISDGLKNALILYSSWRATWHLVGAYMRIGMIVGARRLRQSPAIERFCLPAACVCVSFSGCVSSDSSTITAVCKGPRLFHTPPEKIRLSVGESAVTTVNAGNPENATGVLMQVGEVYEFDCPGAQCWNDAGVTITPGGKSPAFYRGYMSLFNRWKRCRNAPWFCLIGQTSQQKNDGFFIGDHISNVKIAKEGQLIAYANDVPCFYWNNGGSVILVITRRR